MPRPEDRNDTPGAIGRELWGITSSGSHPLSYAALADIAFLRYWRNRSTPHGVAATKTPACPCTGEGHGQAGPSMGDGSIPLRTGAAHE